MIAAIDLSPPWLDVSLTESCQAVSWALIGGGFRQVDRVVWRQVDKHELSIGRDPETWFQSELTATNRLGALGFLTSSSLEHYTDLALERNGHRVQTVVTVGLGNGRRIGDPPGEGRIGTINILCAMSVPMSHEAMLEAMALVVEARTAACLNFKISSPVSSRSITGTGTDCVAVVCPPVGHESVRYAGKHTDMGFLIGNTVVDAVSLGIEKWLMGREWLCGTSC